MLSIDSEDAVLNSVMDLVENTLGAAAVVNEDTDLFSAGLDSLQVIRASRMLTAALGAHVLDIGSKDVVTPRAIYANPTPRRLALYVYSLVQGTSPQDNDDVPERQIEKNTSEMQALLDKYTSSLPSPPLRPKPARKTTSQTVLLTGTTGSLGAALFASLMRNPSVTNIICLNRASDGGLSKRPAVTPADTTTITFHRADLSAPSLGLPDSTYTTLLDSIDTVIHCAWPVNFNIPLSSFEPHIAGVANLVSLVSAAAKSAHIVFISSISEVSASSLPVIPEAPLAREHAFSSARGGYGQSKLVSSLLLDAARTNSRVSSSSIRVGQIAGPRTDEGRRAGVWSRAEWLPSIIASSIHLGILPSDLGASEVVDWVPVEDVVGMVCDVAGVNGANDVKQGYFHCVNPCPVKWRDLVPGIAGFYQDRIARIGGFAEWIAELEKSAGEEEGNQYLKNNPGVKLLDTYRTMLAGAGSVVPRLGMERTLEESGTMRRVGPITDVMMQRWCEDWQF